MPRVKGLTQEQKFQYQKRRVVDQCELLLKHAKVKKIEIAKFLGVTGPAISYQFNTGNLSLDTVMAVATLTNAAPEDIVLRAEI